MQKEDFLSLPELTKCFVHTTVSKEKVQVKRSNECPRSEKSNPYEARFKYTHNDMEAWKVVNLQWRGTVLNFSTLGFTLKFPNDRELNHKKSETFVLINHYHFIITSAYFL